MMDHFFRAPTYAGLENSSRKTFNVKYVKTGETFPTYPIRQIMAGNPTMRRSQAGKKHPLLHHPFTHYHHYNQALWPVRAPIYQINIISQ